MDEYAPTQTPYDTGERFQPEVWPTSPDKPDSYGRVDFENDESATELTVHAGYSGGRTVLEVETHGDDVVVYVDGRRMVPAPHGD